MTFPQPSPPSAPAAPVARRPAQWKEPSSGPWWKYGHMWMVVGGPLIVVVAGFVTLYLAIRTPDPVYTDAPRAPAAAAAPAPGAAALAPAMQARNHAATGGVPRPAGPAASAPPR